MNNAIEARRITKLDPKEFALLLGVPEDTVIFYESDARNRHDISWAAFTLILDGKESAVRTLLTRRLAEAKGQEHDALVHLTTVLHDRQVI